MKAFMAEVTADTSQKEREAVCAAVQNAASFHIMAEQWNYAERDLDFSWITRARKRSIEQSGVRKQTTIGA